MPASLSNIKHEGAAYQFTLSGLNVSLANAIRRTILSDIPVCVIQTEFEKTNQCHITTNTSRLHNEILKQRISCVPVMVAYDEIDLLPDKYELVLDAANDGDNMMFITTEDFKLRNKASGKFCTDAQTKKIFPPCAKTGYYIDFARLRPKISDNIPGESLSLTADFSISTAMVNGSFNAVSKCTYMFTIDPATAAAAWETIAATKAAADVPAEDIAFDKKNFFVLDAQRYYKPDSFDFIVQGIGMYENAELVRIACEVLCNKFVKLIEAIDVGDVAVLNSENTTENCFDLILENEDYTIGKVLEYELYAAAYVKDKTLNFCGFKKFHPHDTKSTLRIAFAESVTRTVPLQYLKVAAEGAIAKFTHIGKMF
jgi:DNA-directed RNA polymerase subunit L